MIPASQLAESHDTFSQQGFDLCRRAAGSREDLVGVLAEEGGAIDAKGLVIGSLRRSRLVADRLGDFLLPVELLSAAPDLLRRKTLDLRIVEFP